MHFKTINNIQCIVIWFIFLTVNALRTLHKVSKEIETKRNKQLFLSIHYFKTFLAGLIFCGILLSLCLSAINDMFAYYHIHWVTTPIGMLLGALLMFVVCMVLSEIHLSSSMTDNIDQIENILHYNSYQNNKVNWISIFVIFVIFFKDVQRFHFKQFYKKKNKHFPQFSWLKRTITSNILQHQQIIE